MTDLRKAAEMALEALMQKGEHHPKVYQAAEALRQALAQHVDNVYISEKRVHKTEKSIHEWVGLTDEEARKFYEKYTNREELIYAIDKFLEEKNGG